MSATATKPRIAPMYYDTPPKTLPPLPTTPAERRQAMADAVFASLLALQGVLTDKNPKVVIQAAGMILDLDKTQMRHSNYIRGTNPVTPLEPLPGMSGYENPYKSAPSERPAPLLPTPEKMAQMGRMTDDDQDFEEDEFDDDLFDEPKPKKANVADPMVAFIEKVRAGLQRIADRDGIDEVVTWEKAEQAARYVVEQRKQANAAAARPTPDPKPAPPRGTEGEVPKR